MSDIHLRRIKTFLVNEYTGHIDLSELEGRSSDVIETNFLTRAQAALALHHIAEIDKSEASQAIVDGYEDNGIDALYYDKDLSIMYVVQSKWVSGGQKSPDLGSIKKFVDGFEDLLAGKFDRFNSKVTSRQAIIEEALDSPDVTFVLVIVYTGIQPLSKHAEERLGDLLEEINDPTDVVKYRNYSQKELYNAISGSLDRTSVNLEVTLHDWGQVREPFFAVYGQVSADEVAHWYQEYDTRLLTRNLRKFKGDTKVNQAIKTTLVSDSGKFWYFNNGITALCDKIKKKPIGGSNRDVGQFSLEGVSVVNGAQTVGVIASAVAQGFQKAKEARVLVRFISLEDCPPGLANEVTTATNTQNRIEPRDFASLDPTQERLRQELHLDVGKTYVYKSGDINPLPGEGCTIDEATIALACAYPDIQLAADVKRYISVLWEDIKKPPYTLIFSNRLSAHRLWRSVQIFRIVEAVLSHEKEQQDGTTRRVAVHGNRLILHRVFQMLPLDDLDDLELDMEPLEEKAKEETLKILAEIVGIIEEHFSNAYLNTFFKSGSKCKKLAEYLPVIDTTLSSRYFAKDTGLQGTLFPLGDLN